MKKQLEKQSVILVALALIVVGCNPSTTPLPAPTQAPSSQPLPTQALPSPMPSSIPSKTIRDSHERLNGVLWMQTAVEYRIVCQTIFDSAKSALDYALKDRTWTAALEQSGSIQTLPPAIVVDLDETIFDNASFWVAWW